VRYFKEVILKRKLEIDITISSEISNFEIEHFLHMSYI